MKLYFGVIDSSGKLVAFSKNYEIANNAHLVSPKSELFRHAAGNARGFKTTVRSYGYSIAPNCSELK